MLDPAGGLPIMMIEPRIAISTPMNVLKLIFSFRNDADSNKSRTGPSNQIAAALKAGVLLRPMLSADTLKVIVKIEDSIKRSRSDLFSGLQALIAKGNRHNDAIKNRTPTLMETGMVSSVTLIKTVLSPHIILATARASIGKM